MADSFDASDEDEEMTLQLVSSPSNKKRSHKKSKASTAKTKSKKISKSSNNNNNALPPLMRSPSQASNQENADPNPPGESVESKLEDMRLSPDEEDEDEDMTPTPPQSKRSKRSHRSQRSQKSNNSNNNASNSSALNVDDSDDEVEEIDGFDSDTRVGTLHKIRLQNFLCHTNLEQVFHPNITIISGANGSGKSAIEAGISMALGVKARQTGRGENIKDLIKYGQDWAIVQLWICNSGPEKLKDYGEYIIIERRLSKPARGNGGGSSSFKVTDSGGKLIGKGSKQVVEIVDKFNMHVDNPCVVLKQQEAKEFLNTTNPKKKFELFMRASKLASFEAKMTEARCNLDDAKRDHKNAASAFGFIKTQFLKAKAKYDEMEKMLKMETLLPQLQRRLAWRMFLDHDKVEKRLLREKEQCEEYVKEHERTEKKMEELLASKEAEREKLRELCAKHAESLETFKQPIDELNNEKKAHLAELRKFKSEKHVKQTSLARKIRDVKDIKAKIVSLQREMEGDNKQAQMNEIMNKTTQLETQVMEANNRLKQVDAQFQANAAQQSELAEKQDQARGLNNSIENARDKWRDYEGFLKRMERKDFNREESFKPRSARYFIANIKRDIQASFRNRKFRHMPVGPIGSYVEVQDARFAPVVQCALQSVLFSFVCDNQQDRHVLSTILQRHNASNITVIVRKFTQNSHNIGRSSFINYTAPPINNSNNNSNNNNNNSNSSNNNSNNSNNNSNNNKFKNCDLRGVYRIVDLFQIKQDSSGSANWIYNTIIDQVGAERAYTHGTLRDARSFLNSLSPQQQRQVSMVYTLNQDTTFRVTKRGGAMSSEAVQPGALVLSKDTASQKLEFQHKMRQLEQEVNVMNQQLQKLKQEINQLERERQNYQSTRQNLQNSIENGRQQLDHLAQQKQELEETMESTDDRAVQLEQWYLEQKECEEAVSEVQEEMRPVEEKIQEQEAALAKIKEELHKLGDSLQMKNAQNEMQVGQFEQLEQQCDKLKRKLQTNKKITQQAIGVVKKKEDELEPVQEKCRELRNRAVELSNGVEDPPRLKTTETAKKLKAEEKNLRRSSQDWFKNNKEEEIRNHYNRMKPKFNDHKDKVNKCSHHINMMQQALEDKGKQFADMKGHVKRRLTLRFALIMQSQGHKGKLEIDYDNKTLEMDVTLKGHDRQMPRASRGNGRNGQNGQNGRVMRRSTRFSSAASRAVEENNARHGRDMNGKDAVVDEAADDMEPSAVRNTKTLSGGERSFTQIAFIMALQEFSGSPFCIYDEFDVFMDSVNRGNSIRILIDTAKQQKGNRQYVFITPHDVSPMMKHGDENIMTCNVLDPPRR